MTKLMDASRTWSVRAVCAAVILACVSQLAPAELSPREYRRMQRDAPEDLRIEILGVRERPLREREREFEITADAKVLRINRTSARIREGEVIKIVYIRHRREKPFPGPGEPPLLERGRPYPAFLMKVEGDRRTFKPAAGSFSFERLEDRRP